MSTFTGSQPYVVKFVLHYDSANLLLKFNFQTFHFYTSSVRNHIIFTSVNHYKYYQSTGFIYMEPQFQSCYVFTSFIRNSVILNSDYPMKYSRSTGFRHIICIVQSIYLFISFVRNYVLFSSDDFIKNSRSTGSKSIFSGIIGNTCMTILMNGRFVSKMIGLTNSNHFLKLQCKTPSKNTRSKITSKKYYRNISSKTSRYPYSQLND